MEKRKSRMEYLDADVIYLPEKYMFFNCNIHLDIIL